MSFDNKEQFNSLIDKILRMLVDVCPAEVELDAKALGFKAGSYEVSSGIIGGFYRATPEEQFLAVTLQWLIAEGFIRAGEHTDHYVATFQSLKLYDSTPDVLTK